VRVGPSSQGTCGKLTARRSGAVLRPAARGTRHVCSGGATADLERAPDPPGTTESYGARRIRGRIGARRGDARGAPRAHHKCGTLTRLGETRRMLVVLGGARFLAVDVLAACCVLSLGEPPQTTHATAQRSQASQRNTSSVGMVRYASLGGGRGAFGLVF
jgi:hypothetical protein